MIDKELIESHYHIGLIEILAENKKFNETIKEYNRLVGYIHFVANFIKEKVINYEAQNTAIELLKPFSEDINYLQDKLNNIDIIDFNGFTIDKNITEKQLDNLDSKDILSINFTNTNTKFFNQKDY